MQPHRYDRQKERQRAANNEYHFWRRQLRSHLHPRIVGYTLSFGLFRDGVVDGSDETQQGSGAARFVVSTIQETRFSLARMGAEDINKLEGNPDLLSVWRLIRGEAIFVLRNGGKSVIQMGNFFPTFQVDMWTDFPWAFVTERNSLVVRLWSLLFSSTFQLCGGLVHEASHYR